MPMKTIPPGYIAQTRVGKKAITVYLNPSEHAALLELSHYEAMSFTEMFRIAFDRHYGKKMERLQAMKSAVKVDIIP